MVGFFIKHKKVRGVITVFLTIIYLSVYLLIGVFVDGGRIRMASTAMEDIQQIATENIMSQYDRGLYEYYGLFGVSDYKTEQIKKDVYNQIHETMNMKVPESVVKSFINDSITGVNSAINNSDILNSNNGSIENVIDYAEQIQKDISESNKKFNPYGIDLKEENISVSYIDLCNTDALRAQIRDDMRYEALMLPAVNFLGSVEELMSVADGIDTVLNITEKTGSKSDIKGSYKEYQNKLKDFSSTFKDFIKETYELRWKEINSLKYKTEEKKPETKGLFGSFSSWLSGLFGSKSNTDTQVSEYVNSNDVDHYQHIKTSFATDNATADDITGLKKSLDDYKNKLEKYCNEFDNEGGWPYGAKLDERVVTRSDGSEYIVYYYGDYSRSEHQQNIRDEANRRVDKYMEDTWGENGQGELMLLLNNTIEKIDNSIVAIDVYMSKISYLVKGFVDDCNETKDKTSKSIYANSIEQHLRQWNDAADQREVLIEISQKLTNLVSNIDIGQLRRDCTTEIDTIVNEAHEGSWHPETKLLSIRQEWINRFHSRMKDLVDSINKYQEQAIGEEQKADVFQIINALCGHNSESSEEFSNNISNFGEINKHDNSDNKIFNYAEYLDSIIQDSANTNSLQFNKEDMEGFEEDGLEDKINGIFTIAKDIVSRLINALIENVYDETYILTNCRDFVHTHQYLNNKETIDEYDDKDTIFNDKFIEDKSDTKYLTDKQFKDYEVTAAEIEYILFGDANTEKNVTTMRNIIFAIRFVLNYMAAMSSPLAQTEAAALGAVPFVGAVLALAAPIVYAIGQACIEVDNIMNYCRKEEVWNGSPTLSLFSPIVELGDKAIKALQDTLIEKVNEIDKIGTKELIEEIRTKNNPVDSNISSGVITLEQLIADDYYEPYESQSLFTTESIVSTVSGSNIKAGYSDYLLIMLFINGFDKKTQISRLQDIIEANMKKAHGDSFSLANTYSQISVETNSTIKYLFMNQSIMKKNFTSTNVDSFASFPLTIKTAFAY